MSADRAPLLHAALAAPHRRPRGCTHYEPLAIYVRNDIRDLAGRTHLDFATTLAHEIFHVASYVSHAYDARPGTRAQRDQAEEAAAIRYEAHVRW